MEPFSNGQPFRADLLVRNAALVHAPGAVPVPGATIVIRDGLISDGPAPAGARELDAAGAVVTAGFWNCHVHLTEPAWSGAARKPAVQLQSALDRQGEPGPTTMSRACPAARYPPEIRPTMPAWWRKAVRQSR